MLIAYCEKCGFRVPDEELAAGTAVKVSENNYLCAKCAPPKKSGKPGESRIGPGYKPAAAKSSRIPAVTPVAAATPAQAAHAPLHASKGARKQDPSPLPFIIGAGGLVALVIAIMLVSAGKKETIESKRESPPTVEKSIGNDRPATTADSPKAQPKQIAPPIAQPETKTDNTADALDRARRAEKEMENFRIERAAKLLTEAKDFSRAHPDDPWNYKDKLTSITTSYRGTPSETEATAILAGLKVPPKPAPKIDNRNLVADPGFESGKFGAWFPWGAPSISNDNAHTGNCCLRLNAGQNGASQEVKNLTPKTAYVVYAWGKITAGMSLQVGVRKHGNNETGAPITQEQYQKVALKFTTGANSTSAEVYFYKGGGNGCVYIDDVTVLPEGAPPPE